ncbi:MAG TPA: hypothetical protein VK524_24190 [Polyangiaceae bacterium]|nr:hypothetical protein [Polyangiaceae bacterium]
MGVDETGAWVRELPVEQRAAAPSWYKKTPEWEFRDGSVLHRVRIEHGIFTGRVVAHVDGTQVFRKTAWGFRHSWPFDVAGRSAILTLVTFPVSAYALTIAGAQIEGGEDPLGLAKPMPKWAWAFVVACLLIPIVTRGGALPMLLGIGAAGACANISRSARPRASRIAWCAAVAVGAWITLAALAVLMAGLTSS